MSPAQANCPSDSSLAAGGPGSSQPQNGPYALRRGLKTTPVLALAELVLGLVVNRPPLNTFVNP